MPHTALAPHSLFEEPLQGKSNKIPFMVFIDQAWGLIYFLNAKIKSSFLSLFN